MDKVLVLGASGLVGKAAAEELSKRYDIYGTYNSNKVASEKSFYFNISEVNSINPILNEIKPSKIVYAMRGEFNFQIELLIELIKYLKSVDGKLYFCSTANVFDGDVTKVHYRHEKPLAESDYGKFKIECEEIIKNDLGDNGVILRLPMIWGKNSPRLNNLKRSLINNEEVHVYTNLYLNNNTDVILAKQISYIINNDLKGTFHVGSKELINYYEFIKKLTKNLGYGNVRFSEETLPEEKYYLAVMPTEGELPKELNFSNEDVITDMLINKEH